METEYNLKIGTGFLSIIDLGNESSFITLSAGSDQMLLLPKESVLSLISALERYNSISIELGR